MGYQSYSRDRSAYFPNNSDLQTLLESAESLGLAKESHYAGDSKSGIGYNVHVGADYRVTKDVTVGGQMGYDTFGNYNETTAQPLFPLRAWRQISMSDLQQHALNYYRQQQLPSGWADLFGVIVNGMMDNAGEQEGLAFCVTWAGNWPNATRCQRR